MSNNRYWRVRSRRKYPRGGSTPPKIDEPVMDKIERRRDLPPGPWSMPLLDDEADEFLNRWGE